ncbi:DUF2953 domain-containing protein [uncultured Methanomethylovorans sp.]|uniref:DUF2953 domain-containing protein n=1 Tax=uncultured Methanomethylovorans sp. TaxID=183759 RepID=UPI002AA9588E|nr:DUF2953 domain-containing protein [uncultured Methanomethylovorans sp.]
MFTAIQFVQIAVMIILLLILLVLFCAIDLVVDLKKKDQDISGKIMVKWLFLSYSKVFYPNEPNNSDSKKGQAASEKEKVEKSSSATVKDMDEVSEEKIINEAKSPKMKKELKAKDILRIFNNIKKPLFRLFKGTISNIRLRCGKCDLLFGLPDPADTGMLCGFLYGVFGFLHQYWRNFSYFLEPRFHEKAFDLQLMADVRIRIYRFIPVFLRFALNWGVLRTGWLLVRTYR